jgi:hypothetical protein
MTDTTPFRIAGAPISWGVCEVPGWGYQLGPDKVHAEMREVGLLATELRPDGFLDTGHLVIGGTDPAELTRQAPERVAHVHFKDVDAGKAKQVQDGRWTYTEGVRRGMYRPLGTGDVDVAAIVAHLARRATTAGTRSSRTRS